MPDYEDLKVAVKREEGCRITGNIEVLRVPGKFHVSSFPYNSVLAKLSQEGLYKFDISHVINHISFGDESEIKYIMDNFNAGILNPLDNVVKKHENHENRVFEYYLKVVPSTYADINEKNIQCPSVHC